MNEVEKRYCERCGTLLEYKYHFSRFDTSNGYRLYRIKATCPHRKHWLDRHDSYWLDDFYGHRYFHEDGHEIGIVIP